MNKKRLVILTTHFGYNFSGGSDATIEVFSRLQHRFSRVVAIGTVLGEHPFENFEFHYSGNWLQTIRLIKQLSDGHTIFYGDFYNSFLFILAGVKCYFTYHDNWPEQRILGGKEQLKSLFYTAIYKWILRRSEASFTVSQFKAAFVSRYSKKSYVIPNGFKKPTNAAKPVNVTRANTGKVLMLGNVDQRKYAMAVKLFRQLDNPDDLQIDIYGHQIDANLARELTKFPFVVLKGYAHTVPFNEYKLLLHTSVSESFGMIYCESAYHEIPVLSFNVGAASEIVKPENGVLVNPFDIQSMQHNLKDMLNRQFHVRKELVDRFSWDRAADQYAKYFPI